ncbi:hypothetical protein [Dactylosporangium sp. NPDC050588]|uniref:hypothetical protein n=1 Tax=Dactylosporangium sp. NPDC050588 TaxID=3157211 RepID=UPI0033E3D663
MAVSAFPARAELAPRASQHMVGVREKIAGEIASGAYMGKDEEGNDRFGTGRADFDLPDGDGAKGRILKDMTSWLRDLRDGNIEEMAEAYVGSFDLDMRSWPSILTPARRWSPSMRPTRPM